MKNKIEITFNNNITAELDDKMRILLGRLIAYDVKRGYLYLDLRNLVKLPNDSYDKEKANKYWGTETIPYEIETKFDDNVLQIKYQNRSFPNKALEYIFNENKDIINSIKMFRDNKTIYEMPKLSNSIIIEREM